MIVADSSSMISLALNCMSGVLGDLGVKVTVTPAVYDEIVSRPSESRRYALEALRINKLFNDGVLSKVAADKGVTDRILSLSNSVFEVKGKPLTIIHLGEAEALSLIKTLGADALLIDERTTRLLIEDPQGLRGFLSERANASVRMNERRFRELSAYIPRVPVLRSTEIAALAYEAGILPKMLNASGKHVLDASLSALKFSGCAITWEEIDEYLRIIS